MRAIRAAFIAASAAGLVVATVAVSPASAVNSYTLVTVGSPSSPFSQNKQNEPAVAIDPAHPNVVAAGANEEIDMEACNAGDPTTCPFTAGVGVSGIYFSSTFGNTWTQPKYSGWTARDCLGPAGCAAHVGPIGTVPNYYEAGLVSDGDPALAFGPRLGSDGTFSWGNGSRLYYANLTSNFAATKKDAAFKGYEAIAVSHVDDVTAAAANDQGAWSSPTIISKQSSTTFSDKEQIWVDNAASSPHFGTVYVCWASFRSNSFGQALPTPLMVSRSTDGGGTWITSQVGPATDNGINQQPDGCTIRTDSQGTVYVFGIAARKGAEFAAMYKSADGGAHFGPLHLVNPVVPPGVIDPVQGRPVMDGVAGARADLAPAPSIDIANGAPTGTGATDRIVMTWSDGSAGLDHEQLMFTESTDGGATWTAARSIGIAGDRPLYTAPAISPDGQNVYVVYNAFTTKYQQDTKDPRMLVGVVLHASVSGGPTGPFTEAVRGPEGDARGSSANSLTSEFLGDYVYAAATDSYAVAVWNDVSNAADCPAVDAYREALAEGHKANAPDVQLECQAPDESHSFGNSNILSATVAAPTP